MRARKSGGRPILRDDGFAVPQDEAVQACGPAACVSRCPYSFHDVKQRSVLHFRGALLRPGLSAFVAIAFASLPAPAAAVRAAATGHHSPLRLQDRFSETPLHEREFESYTINSLRSQYRTHVVSNPAGPNGCTSLLATTTKTHGPLSGGALHARHGNQLGRIIRCGIVACQRRSHDQLVV